MISLPTIDAASVPKDDIASVIAWAVELEIRLRQRSMETTTALAPEPSRQLDVDEAARVMGTSRRWLLEKTRGLKFRTDFSRKVVRFDSNGLRGWMAARGRR